jgi:hypothetical protein
MGGGTTSGNVSSALVYTRKEAVCIENVNKKAIATENLKRHARVPLLRSNNFPYSSSLCRCALLPLRFTLRKTGKRWGHSAGSRNGSA